MVYVGTNFYLWDDNMVKSILNNCDLNKLDAESVAYSAIFSILEKKDKGVAISLRKELQSQRNSLKLIASENYSSIPVQLAMGNFLTDKYAEGHVGHRFYAGCENVDSIEQRACDLLKKIFGAEHAYVQPHSGADANLIAYLAILIKRLETPYVEKLGKKNINQLTDEEYELIRQEFCNQKILGMGLDAGGHLTHGSRVNFSSKMMKPLSYGVDPETGLIDYKKLEEQAVREKPAILIAGYSSYSRLIDFKIMREIADRSGATLLVDMAHFAGLVAGKQFQGKYNPVPYADVITSTTHKTLRGPRGGIILCKKEYAPYINKGCPYAIGGPLPNIIAAKAIAFSECLEPEFEIYAKNIIKNAKSMAQQFLDKGATLISGGTDNHLIVIDVYKSFNISGRAAEIILAECGITVNRNAIPNDKHGAWYTSGIRIGTPALTTRGMKENDMKEIADIIYHLLKSSSSARDPKTNAISKTLLDVDQQVIADVKSRVKKILDSYPLYASIQI